MLRCFLKLLYCSGEADTLGRSYGCPLTCGAAIAAVAQGTAALALVAVPSPLPEVTPCRSRDSETDACLSVCGSCGCWSNGAHPSWCPRKAQGDGSGRALAHDAFCDPAWRRDRTHLQHGMGFAGARRSGPQGINFCCDLHCPYDCSTFLFTLNCLEIKTKDKIIIKEKSFCFCPLGLIVLQSSRSHICT